MKGFFILLTLIGGLVVGAGFSLLGGLFVMLLWNWLIPSILGLGVITFWQAWGLTWLCSILFKPTSVKSNSG